MDYLEGLVLSLSGGVGSYKDTVGFPGGSDGKESAYNVGDPGSIPELGGSPGEGKGYPCQYSGLENCIVHGVTKSRTRLSDFQFHFPTSQFACVLGRT